MNKRLILSFFAVALIFLLNLFTIHNNTLAYEGEGDDADGTAAQCSNYIHGYRKLCGDPAGSDGGGASWHIYSTQSYSGPSYYAAILDGDVTIDTIKANCPRSRYKWYAAYGWDGHNGAHWGPLKQGATLNGRTIFSNTYGAMSYSNAVSAMQSNSISDGQKIDYNAANQLYQLENPGVALSSRSNIGYFCVADPEPTYYSQSNISADAYNTTGITNSGTKAEITVNLSEGDTTPIVFSHNVFASAKASSVYWQIQRTTSFTSSGTTKNNEVGHYVGEGSSRGNYYTILEDNTGVYQNTTDITQEISYGGQAKVIADTRPYTQSGGSSYVARDVYKVKFNKQGKYTFCEAMYVKNTSQKSTEACVTVNVGLASSYLSKSNVSNRDTTTSSGADDYVTTNITGSPETARTDKIKLENGGTVAITFSHNIYSTVTKSNVPYRIERTVNGSAGINGNFEITSTGNSPYSSGNTGSSTGGNANFSTQSQGYYIGDPRNYRDSNNSNSRFILRDFYELKFPAQDATYDICETVYIGSGDEEREYTSACSKITIGKGGSSTIPETPPNNVCSTWTPSSYTSSNERSGETSVIAGTKNTTLGQNWTTSNGVSTSAFNSKPVWAKPGDLIGWIHCYYPGAQKVADELATKNNNHPHPSRLSGNYNTLNNIQMKNYSGWANWFKVTNQNLLSSNYHLGNFAAGLTSIQQWEDTYTVETGNRSRAGLSLTETNTASAPKSAWADTADDSHSWSCNSYKCDPYDCGSEEHPRTCWHTCYETCYHRNPFYKNGKDMSNAIDKAMVKVPYNFTNSASVSIDTSKSNVVYAGETVDIQDASFTVSPKYNGTTNGTYATKVDNAQIRLIAYVSNTDTGSSNNNSSSGDCSAISVQKDTCNIIADRTRQLNDPENTGGHTDHDFSKSNDNNSVQDTYSYNVYDAPAGKNFCIVAALYPADSGGSTNMSASGNNKWYISAPHCVKIAKKPSLQVWGGSLYTASNTQLPASTKRVIAGFHDFSQAYSNGQAISNRNTTAFGSWVEQSIFRGNTEASFSGLASGAASGYYGKTTERTDIEKLGGSHEGANVNLCEHRSPITFPNTKCGTNPSITSSSVNAPTDKSALISRFTNGDQSNYTYITNISSLPTTTIPRGETRVIKSSTPNFTIEGDIFYEDTYSMLTEIPKLIIYADNITINCGVKHIDAVLIANDNINTCNSGNINSSSNSNQLKIFGSVITNTLELNRTYGAAAGKFNPSNSDQSKGLTNGYDTEVLPAGSAASVIPAEIVDYDTSLYLWGAPRADAAASGTLDITYQRELSPRY